MKDEKTSNKRPHKPFTGVEGKTFDSKNQPTPEAKKLGWEERRKQRLLTQSILEAITGKQSDGTDKLKEYTNSLIKLAKEGNAKAIDTVNKAIEDDIQKIQVTGSMGAIVVFEKPSELNERITQI
jgi:hypothetical protein